MSGNEAAVWLLRLEACVAVPVTLPVTSPVTSPVKLPVTFPTKLLPVASVISSCEYIPVLLESNSIFALVDKEVVLPVEEPFRITPFAFLL